MNVESILERKGTEVATIAPEASIKRAADWLRAKNVGALVVTSNDAILGIISERDIVRAFFSVRRASCVYASKGHHDARFDHRVPRG